MKAIELLAPVKDYTCGCAAIDCGADALYVGPPRFGARVDAGVSLSDIERLCGYAHRFGVRVFATMNTLLYESELKEAERLANDVCRAGVDGLIVQDMAFLRMDLPPVELHASTQIFTMTPKRARFWSDVGFTRINLERAATLEEIRAVAQAVPEAEIEVFVHGAICVSYSGRCYMSRSMSPRSGNRGACLQACRLPFDLYDETGKRLMTGKHLLSVRDMNRGEYLEALIDAGVTSFKIEGRLKDINYVRNVVGYYRNRLDALIERRDDLQRASQGRTALGFTPDPRKSFSRGTVAYYLMNPQESVASFDTPKSMGDRIGTVEQVGRDYLVCSEASRLAPGDGICFKNRSGVLSGTSVNRVEPPRVYPNRMEGIERGTELYRNYDRRFVLELDRARTERKIPVEVTVEIGPDRVTLGLNDREVSVSCMAAGPFDEARDADQAEKSIRTQVAKMGNTIYEVEQVTVRWDRPRFVPAARINALRREAVERLDTARVARHTIRQRKEERRDVPFPLSELAVEENVTNSLAERFYRDHGVVRIERGEDLSESFEGLQVMRMRYCLRRELGWCLRKHPKYTGRLFIETGPNRYELKFDCRRCEMRVVCLPKREKNEKKRA